jgi:hypothetical protein
MAEDQIQAEPPRDPEPRRPEGERPRPRRPRYEDEEEEPDERRRYDPVETFIPYRNPKALIAYYLGVFALIPCLGLALGPAALILGIMGLRYSGRHPEARGAGHAITGIVLGALTALLNWGVVVALAIGLATSK